MTLQFEWFWAFGLLPLPLIVRFLAPGGAKLTESALRTSFAEDLHGEGESWSPARNISWLILATLVWVLLVISAARPQLLGDPRPLPVAGRDLMMAVDVSGSMRLRDFRMNGRQVTRLAATKRVAGDFIERRTGDRMGLILFGRRAYLQTPLTFDRRTVAQLLNESFVGMAGSETAIGDAIGLAIKRLRENNVEKKTLILLTDGANTAGAVDPLKAAQLAEVEGLTIYTVGIGADPRTFSGIFGGGGARTSSLDEKTLETIATTTGGRYFRARDARELAAIYALLDELEPVEHDTAGFRPTRSLFQYPLGLALVLGGLLLSLRLSLWSGLFSLLFSRRAHD